MAMTIKRIQQVLAQHGIESKTENDRVFALDMSTCRGELITAWHNVTGYSERQLKKWLGY